MTSFILALLCISSLTVSVHAMESKAKSNVVKACNVCHKSPECGEFKKLKVCGRCKAVYYCSANCQKTDWKEHKKSCKPTEAQAGTSKESTSAQHAADPSKRFDAKIAETIQGLGAPDVNEGKAYLEHWDAQEFTLLDQDEKIRRRQDSPFALDTSVSLHNACWVGDLEQVKRHVKGGADVDKRDVNGRTPLHHACSTGRLGVIKYLVEECGVQVNTKPHKDCQWAPLDLVFLPPQYPFNNPKEVEAYLRSKGAFCLHDFDERSREIRSQVYEYRMAQRAAQEDPDNLQLKEKAEKGLKRYLEMVNPEKSKV